ncbi:transglycosylase domain-containing protein [Myxococcota bacterium]|nr:transglycosylase domain-containing protein [Myxococcota bacterium]
MTGRGLGLALVGVLAVALLGVGLAEREALRSLKRQGLRWQGLDRGLTTRTFHAVTGPGFSAERVSVDLRGEVITVHHAQVDALALAQGDGGEGGEGGGGEGRAARLKDWTIDVDSLGLYAGERLLVDGLAGRLEGGEGALVAEAGQLTLPGPDGARAELRVTVASPIAEVQGEAALTLTLSDPPRLTVEAEALTLNHPLLAAEPLPLRGVRLSLAGDPREEARGRLVVRGGPDADLTLRCVAPPACELLVEMTDQPAAVVLSPFAPLVPELRRAELDGTLGATMTLSWPSRAWTITPRMANLSVRGAAQGLDGLRGGRVEVRRLDGGLRPIGEGTPGWTPLRMVSPYLPAAIVAAEDAAFYRHDGYDPEALLEALAANQAAGEVVRGGSTLTQQLAKNLYLSGERTLVRKLRELLLALELDEALGKDRVMELYVNVVELGPDLWGVDAACERYFLRSPANLSPAEAVFLALLLPSPKDGYERWYLRDRPPRDAMRRVLENMVRAGALTEAEAQAAAEGPLILVPPG